MDFKERAIQAFTRSRREMWNDVLDYNLEDNLRSFEIGIAIGEILEGGSVDTIEMAIAMMEQGEILH